MSEDNIEAPPLPPTTSEMLAAILKALDGVTILEKPRVSKKTIVNTLKEHSNILQGMRGELSDVTFAMKKVYDEAAENRIYITTLKEDSARQLHELEKLSKTSDEFRKQMTTIFFFIKNYG